MLFRLLKDDVRMQNLTKDNAYSDVSDTAWYAAAVSTLSKMGIISGYPDGTFRPNAPITRAEFAAMIARFDETAKSADTPFTDISGHWAENAIGKAYGNGWVEGSSKTVFCPESNLTRAETATLLNRVLHRLPEKESDLACKPDRLAGQSEDLLGLSCDPGGDELARVRAQGGWRLRNADRQAGEPRLVEGI